MPHRTKKSKSRTLAEAVLLLSQRVHACYPQAVMTPIEVPYTDEDISRLMSPSQTDTPYGK